MAVFETLLEIAIYSAVIFTATMFVKVCFKGKMSPALQYAVWGIFLLRLMIPLSIESPVHLITVPAETTVSIEEPMPNTENDISNITSPNIEAHSNRQNTLYTGKTGLQAENAIQGGYALPAVKQAAPLTLPQILLIIWLCGIGACLGCYAALALFIKKKLKNRQTVPSKRLLALLEQVKTEFGIRANLKTAFDAGHGTPALLFPNTVSLPVSTLCAMDDDQIRNCLRHECMHYKRGDQIVNILLLLLSAVYWFNPVVWLAFFQIRRDMEIACDSAVVRYMDTSARRDYATLILSMFSQAKRGQITLGMAQCGTRKAAEQRIRGIFMKNSSGKGMRFMAAALALVLFVCCFTTACQPTPEAPVVIGKGDGLSDIIQSTPEASEGASPTAASSIASDGLYTKLGAPKHWSLETTALAEKLNIKADVDIKLPGVSQLPAATASLSEFTQEDLDKVANAFGVGDAEWTEINNTMTKEQIEEGILDYQARRAEYEAEGDDELVKHMDENIEAYKQMYEDAPSEIELKSIEFKIGVILSGEDLVSGDKQTVIGFEGTTQVDDQPFYFYAGSDMNGDSVNRIRANFGSGHVVFGGVDINAPYNVSLTKEQAAEQASEIAKQLTGELTLCYVTPAASGRDGMSRNLGWACVFMREINGCPTAYETAERPFSIEAVNVPVNYEKMIIVMDDAGMVSFIWDIPMKISSIDNPDVSLLSFDEISQRAIEQIAQRYADSVSEDIIDGVDWGDPGCTANIIKVELGLTRVDKLNSNDYYYIPVWKFFAETEHTDEYYERTGTEPMGNNDFIDEDRIINNINFEYDYARMCNVITINALDGSAVDSGLGY